MARNFLPLISYLIASITKPHGGDVDDDLCGLLAFMGLGDNGTVENDLTQLKEMVQLYKVGIGDVDYFNSAISCGQSAAAFGALFFGEKGRTELKNKCEGDGTTDALKEVIKDNQPKLIRLDIGSHSYVIEQIASPTSNLQGNVYQSNIAVYGYSDGLGCTIQDFLDSYQNPVDLSEHLKKVKEVCDDNSSWELLYKERARDERYALYKELYVGKGFIERQDETKIHDGFKAAYDEGKLAQQLRIKKVTWAPIEKDSEERAYGNMKLILQYSHHLQEGLEKIWQQKG